ncbi:histone family protein [Methanopyrus sp.]
MRKKLPVAPFDRALRAVGGDVRVSRKASETLRDHVQRLAEEIGKRAGEIAASRGSRFVERVDIERAFAEVVFGIDSD